MEIRANYIMVGLFTLLVFLAGLGFTLWLGSKEKGVAMTEYDISVNESVKGLSVNNDVLFNGIRVGKVTEIKISRLNPKEVRVRIAIAADTPVREDSAAQLELRGITGISVIAISGGTVSSPIMHIQEGTVGEIKYAPSTISSVVSQLPDVIESSNKLLQRLEQTFSPQNAQALTDILASLSKVSTTLADRSDSLNSIIVSLDSTIKRFDILAANANQALVTDVKATSQAMTSISQRVNSTLAVMEPGLKQFSTQGLADMRMLMVEMRNLVHVLTRVSQKLESDPRRFLFGEPVKEYTTR